MRVTEFGGMRIGYYEEADLAECRVCHVRPVYNDGRKGSGTAYVRCPVCGIKTGTSTSGLEGVLPTWNRLMVDGWEDPKEGLNEVE